MSNVKNDLEILIRQALAGTSSQQPMTIETIAPGHRRSRIEAALTEMYIAREVCCCKIIKGGHESIVWWLTDVANKPYHYGRTDKGIR